MNIHNVNEGPKHLVVKLDLVIDRIMDLGKIEITPRWEAAAKQLLTELNQKAKLVQIDAAETLHNQYWQTLQVFYFYFLKECEDGE